MNAKPNSMRDADAPEWSVVIPTFNRLAVLREVIEALGEQEGPRFEVVVVVDGSSDGTADWLHETAAGALGRKIGLRPVCQSNEGPAVARNRGVSAARGRWVAFLGDDTVPAPGWLAAHAEAQNGALAREVRAAGGCVGVIGRADWHPRMRRTPFLDYINEHGLQFGFALIEDADDVPFNFFYTSNLSVDREAMAAEPFDPAFPFAAWEDVEAGYRLVARGLRLLYRPAARVAHDHPTDLARFAQRQYRSGYSAVVFFRRHEQLGHFLGMQNGAPPPPESFAARALLRVQEGLARTLQRRPVRLPRLWEKTMRHHYLRGLRKGWSDGAGRRNDQRTGKGASAVVAVALLLGLGLAGSAAAAPLGALHLVFDLYDPYDPYGPYAWELHDPYVYDQYVHDSYIYDPYIHDPYTYQYEWAYLGYPEPDAGALDINTRPKKASVYLDGELVGRVGAFDGFPRYLWLREGSYRLAVFMEGYETLERNVSVRPGVVIRIDEDLVPGDAARPQPPPPAHVPARVPERAPASERDPERVRERTVSPGESWRVENRGRPIDQDQRSDPARLVVEVLPADAVVYLDGRLLGSGDQLANLHSPLVIDPGTHRLEVMRPGYASDVRAFEAAKGEDVSLRIELQPE